MVEKKSITAISKKFHPLVSESIKLMDSFLQREEQDFHTQPHQSVIKTMATSLRTARKGYNVAAFGQILTL